MLHRYAKTKISIVFFLFSYFIFAQQEIVITGGASQNIVDGAVTSSFNNNTNFGLFDISSGIKTRTYMIRNIGNQNLILGPVPVSFVVGSSPTFSVVSQPAPNFIIIPGASVTFTIGFDPVAVTSTNATVSVASNDTSENPFTFLVEGEGAQIYPDTDGDGLSDNIDIDDDNDGLRDSNEQLNCLTSTSSSSIETVFLNEDFNAGITRAKINGATPGVTTTYCYEDGTTAMGADECDTNPDLGDGKYTVHYSVGNGIAPLDRSNTGTDVASWEAVWYTGLDHTPGDTNGRMAIFNASFSPGVFYETLISGTLPNVPTNYSFWALNIDANDAAFGCSNCRILPNVTVRFLTADYATVLASFNTGDITRCNAPGNACVTSDWKNYTTTVNLAVSEFVIQFINNAPGGLGNDIALDDIKITQTLCDIDSDGIADVLDLDNDNDGIPNIMEFTHLVNNDLDGDATTAGPTWVDANTNGMHDAFESLTAADFDGDGTPNYIDLDSDNDGAFDAYEYDQKGDIDSNGDGTGDGNDIKTAANNDEFDGDGILGIMDTNDSDANATDHGNNSYPLPLDSDSDGLPNYLDVYNNTTLSNYIASTIYASYDANNNGIIDGSGDSDKDGILNIFDTNDVFYGSPRDINLKTSLSFDGRNDYIEDAGDIVLGLSQASLMSWVKLDTGYNSNGVVVGQDNFYLKISNTGQFGVSINGTNVNLSGAANKLAENKWIHLAATYNGGLLSLYINGELKTTQTVGTIVNNSSNKLFRIGSAPLVTNSDFFKGEIEEVRVFNTALTADQLQKMIYQELTNTNFARGAVIPDDIPFLSATSLVRYYRMDTFKNDIVDNLVSPTVDLVTGAKLYNIHDIYFQTAPLPYETVSNGNWSAAATWKNGNVWDAIDKPWRIVHIKNNVTKTTSEENLGLIVDSGAQLTISGGDLELKNNWYIKLDGTIDLQNKSQLLQTANSFLDATSSGKIEREQQGIANLYNYNYWSSPVSTINNTTNNNGFSLANVFKDASNPSTLQNINWIGGYNGAPTSPLSIASFWLYKFQNLSDLYANWTAITPSSTLQAGQGFTMKGVTNNFTGALQNYAFVGKPNNGLITIPIAASNINLAGNPYPSAIDSREFIRDNIDGGNPGSSNALTGTLYFWQHAQENNSHNLAAYRGGYATLNLVGGVAPMVASVGTFGVGSSSKIPNRHIPVGQGFFVKADASGGNIQFKNSQRAFKLESDNSTTGSNQLIRSSQITENTEETQYKKLRLNYQSSNGFEKQILLGFMNNDATDGIDIGYDSEGLDETPSDFSFKVSDKKLVIQGVGSFTPDKILPLFVKNEIAGNVKFKVQATENFDSNQAVYIYDSLSENYYEIQNNEAVVNLEAGVFENRFSLRFLNTTLDLSENTLENNFSIYVDGNNQIVINNKLKQNIDQVELYTILGQKVLHSNTNTDAITINASGFATGTYILKMYSNDEFVSRKIILN